MMRFSKWLAAIALLGAQCGAWAQPWPAKPLRVIVPFTPGSATDIMARTVAEKLSGQLGQPVLIDNRPGGGGTIGVALVAKADPDGYTLLVHSSSYTVTPTTYPDTPYNTLRDLTGVTPLGLLPNVLVIAPLQGAALGEGSGGRRESEARRLQRRVDRQRQRHAPQRGAVSPRRGHRCGSRPPSRARPRRSPTS